MLFYTNMKHIGFGDGPYFHFPSSLLKINFHVKSSVNPMSKVFGFWADGNVFTLGRRYGLLYFPPTCHLVLFVL